MSPAVDLKVFAPEHAPGEGVAESLKNTFYVMKSNPITVGDSSPVEIFNVPANTFIYDLIAVKTTAWDASTAATMTVGDSDDADRFMAASDADIQNVGSKSMKQAESPNQVGAGGHFYTSKAQIQATLSNEDASTGSMYFLCVYKTFSDEL